MASAAVAEKMGLAYASNAIILYFICALGAIYFRSTWREKLDREILLLQTQLQAKKVLHPKRKIWFR